MEDMTYRLPTDVPSRISLSTSSKLATAARLAAAKLPPSINCFDVGKILAVQPIKPVSTRLVFESFLVRPKKQST
jgi:hypothetical protein